MKMAQHEITGVRYCVQILSAIFIYNLYGPIVCIKERFKNEQAQVCQYISWNLKLYSNLQQTCFVSTSTGLSIYFLESQTVLESLTNVFCVMMLEQFQFCPIPSLSKDVLSGRRGQNKVISTFSPVISPPPPPPRVYVCAHTHKHVCVFACARVCVCV